MYSGEKNRYRKQYRTLQHEQANGKKYKQAERMSAAYQG